MWHLADLEREAYGVRIRRLLTEDEPALSNFDGDRIARERGYQDRSLAEGLAAFALARAPQRRAAALGARARPGSARGHQESVGPVTLADLPRMMAEHDRSHAEESAPCSRMRRAVETPRPTSAVA